MSLQKCHYASQICFLALLLVWCSRTSAAPGLDALIGDQPAGQNIRKLIIALEQLQSAPDGDTSGSASGTLKDTLTLLQASRDPVAVRDALKQLLPELAAHQVLKRTRLPGFSSFPRRRLQSLENTREQPFSRDPGAGSSGYGFSGSGLAGNGILWLGSDTSFQPSTGIWLQAFSDSSEQNDRNDVNGFDADSSGLAVGLERDISPNTRLGIAFSRTDADVDSNRFGRDKSTSDDYSVYSSTYFGNLSLSTNLSYSDNQTDRVRVVRIQTDAGARTFALQSDIDSQQISALVSLNWNRNFDNGFTLSPLVSLSYSKLETDDYLERGAGELSLLVSTDDEEQIIGALGVSLSYATQQGNWLVLPELHVALEHDFRTDDTKTFSRFRGTRFGFESRGYSIEENRLRGGISLGFLHFAGFSMQLGIDLERKDDYHYLAGLIGVRYGF